MVLTQSGVGAMMRLVWATGGFKRVLLLTAPKSRRPGGMNTCSPMQFTVKLLRL